MIYGQFWACIINGQLIVLLLDTFVSFMDSFSAKMDSVLEVDMSHLWTLSRKRGRVSFVDSVLILDA